MSMCKFFFKSTGCFNPDVFHPKHIQNQNLLRNFFHLNKTIEQKRVSLLSFYVQNLFTYRAILAASPTTSSIKYRGAPSVEL